MGLEVSTYIDGLVVTNPVGATDPKSQGDDHIRLLKSTIKNTFPNLTGAMTATQGNLNGAAAIYAADIAAAGMVADIAALTDLNADRILFWDDSAGAVAQLTPDGTSVAISGTSIATGVNVPLLNIANNFTTVGRNTITINNSGANVGSILSYGTNSVARGLIGYAGAGGADIFISGAAAGDLLLRSESGGLIFSGNAGTTAHVKLSNAGLVTTPNVDPAEVGYKGLPVASQTGNYTLVLADADTMIYKGSGATATWTIPANASVPFPPGTVMTFANRSGNPQNIAITTDTLVFAGSGATGTRSLATSGYATAIKVNGTEWLISGAGLS